MSMLAERTDINKGLAAVVVAAEEEDLCGRLSCAASHTPGGGAHAMCVGPLSAPQARLRPRMQKGRSNSVAKIRNRSSQFP